MTAHLAWCHGSCRASYHMVSVMWNYHVLCQAVNLHLLDGNHRRDLYHGRLVSGSCSLMCVIYVMSICYIPLLSQALNDPYYACVQLGLNFLPGCVSLC